MTPYFSIIIPAHNEERNIGKLLDTISKQSYKDFEVIVSDSDSEDETCKVIEGYRKQLPSLALLEEKMGPNTHKANILFFLTRMCLLRCIFLKK
jgi:glycosyltransferase involved in cell wall biosynthesis